MAQARGLFIGAALWMLAACGGQDVPKDLEAGEKAVAAEAQDGDTVLLEGGLKVHLAGIQAPGLRQPMGKEARQALETLTLGREASLYYGGAKRYAGRDGTEAALAHVFVRSEGGRTVYVQEAMVLQGLAWVRSRPDNAARTDRLLKAEAAARAAKRGVWSVPDFAVKDADAIAAAAATEPGEDGETEARAAFQIVQGRVRTVQATERRTYLNFGDDPRSDFTIAVDADDLAAWPNGAADLEALKGKRVRARGYVSDRGGPLMRVDHPAAIETLAAAE